MALFEKKTKEEAPPPPAPNPVDVRRNSEIQTTVQVAMQVYSTMFARSAGAKTHLQMAVDSFAAAEAFVALLKQWKLPEDRAAEMAAVEAAKKQQVANKAAK